METAIKTQVKASELRIGNYLHTHTFRLKQTIQPRIVVVDELKHLKADVAYLQDGHRTMNTTHLFYRELSGIPLSPKLLGKCGFESQVGEHETEWLSPLVDGHLGFFYISEENGKFWPCTKDDYDRFAWMGKEIFYLHQLQNLYFALTGKELEVSI